MATATTHSPEITRAAERYLEQYGDPLVMNTYLKVTILVLAVVCLALAALLVQEPDGACQHAPDDRAHQRRWPGRSDRLSQLPVPTSGGGEQVLPHPLGGTLFLAQSLHHRTRPDELALLPERRRPARGHQPWNRRTTSSSRTPGTASLPFVDVEVKNVVLDDLRQSPYSARIEFEKVYTNSSDHTELKRERWTASVTYVFRENVKNNELAVDPLGLTIVRFRADQAFN